MKAAYYVANIEKLRNIKKYIGWQILLVIRRQIAIHKKCRIISAGKRNIIHNNYLLIKEQMNGEKITF